jgi:2-dehydropantoate 2-reductase
MDCGLWTAMPYVLYVTKSYRSYFSPETLNLDISLCTIIVFLMGMDNTKRSYAVIGVGAVGGLYGARLQNAGHEVHYLLHNDYEHVREHGLEVKSFEGDILLPKVNAYSRAEDIPDCDVIIIALKTTQNHLLQNILSKMIKGNEIILLMQNGLGAEEELHEMFQENIIVGGLCFLCCNKIGPGVIHHQDFGHVHIGEYRPNNEPAGITETLKAVESDLAGSGTKVQSLDDLLSARWHKLVWNVPFNGMTVVRNCTTDKLMANKATYSMAKDLMLEVVKGAAAFGRDIEMAFVEQMLEYTQSMTPYKPSMMLDYENGKPMELEAIYGNPVRAAADKGVELHATKELYDKLRVLDQRRTDFIHPV